jgi:hypoxanthine phosphoribosyltransferase
MNDELNLSWAEVEQAVSIIINRIGNKKYDYVVGIANGGLIPATLIAKKLKLKTMSVGLESYDGKDFKNVTLWSEINKRWYISQQQGLCLLVDDISDSGKSFNYVKNAYLKKEEIICDTASLVVKPKTTFMPDYFAMNVHTDTWVKFPWE